MKASDMKHLCNFCKKNYPECSGKIIEWGIDIDPNAQTEDFDKIINCDNYENEEEK
jgi:hypothetical protein